MLRRSCCKVPFPPTFAHQPLRPCTQNYSRFYSVAAPNKPSDMNKVIATRMLASEAMNDLKQELQSMGYALQLWESDEPMPREELLKQIPGASAVLCMLSDRIDTELLEVAGDSLKTVSTYSVGFDHIDIEECKRRNITVSNTPGVLTQTTAELAFSIMLSASRRIPEGMHAVRSGEWKTWKPQWLLGRDIAESTVGVVGMGRIGMAFAKMCRGFNPARILYTARSRKTEAETEIGGVVEHVDFDTLLKESDFVSVHCPLTPETYRLFNAASFGKMKSSAVFVNTSRGSVVDQEALYDALVNKQIFAAALDVTEPEPLPADNPLLTLDNCIVVPHIGSASVTTRRRMAYIAAHNLTAALKHEAIPHQVV